MISTVLSVFDDILCKIQSTDCAGHCAICQLYQRGKIVDRLHNNQQIVACNFDRKNAQVKDWNNLCNVVPDTNMLVQCIHTASRVNRQNMLQLSHSCISHGVQHRSDQYWDNQAYVGDTECSVTVKDEPTSELS